MLDLDVFDPATQEVVRLALEHGSLTCIESVAFWAEMAVTTGNGDGMLAEVYEIINERRAAKGLPPVGPETLEG